MTGRVDRAVPSAGDILGVGDGGGKEVTAIDVAAVVGVGVTGLGVVEKDSVVLADAGPEPA